MIPNAFYHLYPQRQMFFFYVLLKCTCLPPSPHPPTPPPPSYCYSQLNFKISQKAKFQILAVIPSPLNFSFISSGLPKDLLFLLSMIYQKCKKTKISASWFFQVGFYHIQNTNSVDPSQVSHCQWSSTIKNSYNKASRYYFSFFQLCISQFQVLPSPSGNPLANFQNRQIPAPWANFVSNPRRLGFPGTLNF